MWNIRKFIKLETMKQLISELSNILEIDENLP